MISKKFTLLVFALFLINNLLAQEGFEFEQLTGDNIATQSITYAIKQDSIGNIWIASEEGVLKYDSKQIKIYNTYNGLPENINNRITALFIDSNQRKWIGLEQGICLYDDELDKFNLIDSKLDINPSLINAITEDEYGNIWVGGFNGLWKCNPTDKKIEQIVAGHSIKALSYKNNRIIFGTTKGLFKYNTNTDLLTEINIAQKEKNIWFIGEANKQLFVGTNTGELYTIKGGLNYCKKIKLQKKITHPITDIIEDRFSNLYIATDGEGLYYLNKNFEIINHLKEDVDNPYSLSSNGIYDIELGNENILWIATYSGGVNYYDFNKRPFQRIKHIVNNKNTIATNFSRSITKDKNGNIWFGTTKGISIWNPITNTWKHIPKLSKSPGNEQDIVLALEADENFIWAGTYNDGLFKININNFNSQHFSEELNKEIDINKVYAVCKDSNNNIWFGGIDGSLSVIRPDNSIDSYPIFQIKSIIESNTGKIIAAGRFGVYKIDDSKKEFELFEKTTPNKQNLAFATLNAIDQTEEGVFILATNGAGLVFHNPNTDSISKLIVNSGLPSDIIQGIIVQNENTIWASTTKGLAQIRFTENDTLISIFDKHDGLSTTEFNYGSYSKLNDSLFAFGGRDGVTLFNPNNVKGYNFSPTVVFDELKVFNKTIPPGTKPLSTHINNTNSIVLKNKENSIELKFTGILHSSASKIKYSWKLDGFDDSWSTPSTNSFATYTNLNSGEYTFRVKASNKFGDFGKERIIKLNVKSPWWATSYAFLLYIILAIGILLSIIHFTSVMVNKKNADQQIDFFNNITHEIKTPLTILMSSLDDITENKGNSTADSNKRIKTTVKRINSLFEQLLNFHKVTSEHNIDQDISKIELEHHFAHIVDDFKPLTKERGLKINIDNQWQDELFYYDQEILDKIVLNLISNAIKYSFDDNKIDIKLLKTKKDELKLEISDYGLGIPKDQQKYILNRYYRARNVINSQRPGTGLGLVMVKRLLQKTGGTISFQSMENKGTTFIVTLKNLKAQYKESALHKDQLESNIKSEIEDQLELDQFSDSKILIVEDNDELRSIMVNTLGVYFQIYEAKNGIEGLEMASQIFPDLILTDLIMPEMDGMQMSRKLKNDINLNHIPVFMLTVMRNSAQKLESIESGISEYIEKPVDIKFLLAKITNTLKWQQKLRSKFIHESDSDSASLFRNKNDQEFLLNLENSVLKNIENNAFSVHDLSKSFGMSRTSLYMKLKNLVDLSPQDFIIHTKLKHAKKLLIEGEYSIKEVAYNSGFSNPKYFSTSFKKFYGITPSGFIESLQKK